MRLAVEMFTAGMMAETKPASFVYEIAALFGRHFHPFFMDVIRMTVSASAAKPAEQDARKDQ